MSKGCNHKWQDFGAYKKCLVCGCIDMSSKMAAIQGIVSEVEDCEDGGCNLNCVKACS